jgi:tetratricopeptide (TPR) repeat protein
MDMHPPPVAGDERFQKGIAARRKKNYDYARELFQQVLHDYPDSTPCRHHLWAVSREKLQNHPLPPLLRLMRVLQRSMRELQSLLHELSRNAQHAIASQERAVLLSPDSIPVLLRLANLFSRHNFPLRQRATLEEILGLQENNYPALRQLARLYFANKEYRNAKTAAQRALALNPRDLEAENILRDIAVLGVIEEGFDALKPAT